MKHLPLHLMTGLFLSPSLSASFSLSLSFYYPCKGLLSVCEMINLVMFPSLCDSVTIKLPICGHGNLMKQRMKGQDM